jgi:hypothetical protein
MNPEQIYNILDTESQWPLPTENDGADQSSNASRDPNATTDSVSDGGFDRVLDAPAQTRGDDPIEDQAGEWTVAVNQAIRLSKQAEKFAGVSHVKTP